MLKKGPPMLPTTSPFAPPNPRGLAPQHPPRCTVWGSTQRAGGHLPPLLYVGLAGGRTRKDLLRWFASPLLCPSAPSRGMYPGALRHNEPRVLFPHFAVAQRENWQ